MQILNFWYIEKFLTIAIKKHIRNYIGVMISAYNILAKKSKPG